MDAQHHLCSSQKEADTKINLHNLGAVERGATELYIQSTNTDMFILALRHYHQLCKKIYFKRKILLVPIMHAFGGTKAATFLGSMLSLELTRLACFLVKESDILLSWCPFVVVTVFFTWEPLTSLHHSECDIEVFVCQLNEPGTAVVNGLILDGTY